MLHFKPNKIISWVSVMNLHIDTNQKTPNRFISSQVFHKNCFIEENNFAEYHALNNYHSNSSYNYLGFPLALEKNEY